MHWSWGHFAEFWQTPTGVVYLLALPVVLLLATSVIYLAEKELKKRPSQILVLSLVAYEAAWLVLAIPSIISHFNPSLWISVVLAFMSCFILAPLITYLAVLITFQCSPQEALRFWGRWMVLIAVLLLVLAIYGLGVASY